MDIDQQCQVLRCQRSANTVFQVRGAGMIVETLVCDEHDAELQSSTGWVWDHELRRIRMGADAPAKPTGWKVSNMQDGGETFTITYQRSDEDPEDLDLWLSDEARRSLIRALRGSVASDDE